LVAEPALLLAAVVVVDGAAEPGALEAEVPAMLVLLALLDLWPLEALAAQTA
jgi:hypothetical protein